MLFRYLICYSWKIVWAKFGLAGFFKVHILWEGHKILRNFHLTFVCMYCRQRWRLRKILWLSQSVQTLKCKLPTHSSYHKIEQQHQLVWYDSPRKFHQILADIFDCENVWLQKNFDSKCENKSMKPSCRCVVW